MTTQPNTVKCPNCAATIDTSTAVGGVVRCRYCKQPVVLPKTVDNAAYAALETANNFLNLCNFDSAFETYRSVADKFPDEPEAYFGMALATNKVRYINDVKNNCLQPICYDATNKSFVSDGNYIKALSLAMLEQKSEYVRKATEIDYIRNEFYKLKQSGKVYDCFICVKVTGDNGYKTIDNERANDIYYHLKDKGYRPFYSEREIQNETGADYEARILYALFSSPCMLVVCSDESYLQTPWVKNEYSRFISLINDEQKEANSIAIGFFDYPIERLPGRNGRLQGVCLKNPDAYSKIVDFVDKHYDLNAGSPQISRKTYSQVAYQKRAVVKSQIQKRTLAKFEQSAITVSEQSKLDIAKSMLDSGNFNAVIVRCKSILETNKSCSLAYWYMFLAENECKTGEEFELSQKQIRSFDGLESTIATADSKLKKVYYDALFSRAMADRRLYIYDEYISLPDSDTDSIKRLTAAIYSDLLESAIVNDTIFVFEALMKTVDNTDIYIEMNLGFADRVFDSDKEYAKKCYRDVLNVDASNGHAIWQLLRINNNLNTTADVTAYLIFKENHCKIESEVFDYGFNRYAVEQMFEICLSNIMIAPEYNVVRFDFIFSLIPQNEKELYNKYINEVTNSLLVEGQFTAANRYNDIIIAEDKYNDMAYFKRLYIKRKTINPFEFAENCDSLYDDPDFSAAVDVYAEKHIGEKNIYIDLINQINKIKELGKVVYAYLLQYGMLSSEGLCAGPYKCVLELIENLPKSEDNVEWAIIQFMSQSSNYNFFDHNFNDNAARCEQYGILMYKLAKENVFDPKKDCRQQIINFLALIFTDKQIQDGIKASESTARVFRDLDSIESKFKPGFFEDTAASLCGSLFRTIDSVVTGQPWKDSDSIAIMNIMCYAKADGARKVCSFLASNIKDRIGEIRPVVEFETIKNIDCEQMVLSGNEISINNNVFLNCKLLTNIEIPDSFAEIGSGAFSGCSALCQIKLGNRVQTIGVKAFSDCSALTQISIPDSVTEIGSGAFSGCKSLSKLTVGRGIKHIGNDAFKDCIKPTIYISDISSWCNIKFGNDTLRFVDKIYLGDKLITDLVIPQNVERVIAPSFGGCMHIKRVSFENGVKHIGKYAFYECVGIKQLVLSDSLISIDESAFYSCSEITNLEIPIGVTFIGDEAFFECDKLTSVIMPKRFKKDRFRIFGDKQSIKHIKFAFIK